MGKIGRIFTIVRTVLYEQYQSELVSSAKAKDQDTALDDMAGLRKELAELEKTSNLSSAQSREELARLHEEIAKSLRSARAQ